MDYEQAKRTCHVRSAIFRKSKGKRHWKNHTLTLDERISAVDKLADDWLEYDPRDNDHGSLSAFND